MAPDLNEEVEVLVQDSDVITVPIDATLSNSGEAADAKAVGDALALKADADAVVAIDVNGQGADNQGHILIDGTDIPMSGTDSTTLKAAIETVDGKTGADIKVSAAAGADTIQAAVEAAGSRNADEIMMATGSTTTIAAKISAMDVTAAANSVAISNLEARTGDEILLEEGSSETIADAVNDRVKSVNGTGPDATGNVQVEHALTADDLTSASSQNTVGEWTRRTSGGTTPIQNGNAWLSTVRGNRSHVGYVPEVLNMVVTPAPREEGQTPITATIDRDIFVAEASGSGTYNFVYTTSWSTDPETYGITVAGTPVSGDQIVVTYTAEDRGTIIQSLPKTMIATGWNLAQPTEEYTGYTHIAIALKYADTAMFKIIGTYTGLKFSSTTTGEKTTITPSDGLFTVAANGYLFVAGGSTDTAIYMTWTDWLLDGPTTAEDYEEYEIDMTTLFEGGSAPFPYGLLRAGDVRDEIDFNTGNATSRVQRLTYSQENLEAAAASGLTYEYDTNYIYLERAVSQVYDFDIDGEYTVNDHGLEYFTDTDISVYAVNIYGNSLKNKLEKDVLTKSQDLVNNLTTNDSTKALSAAQGYALNSKLSALTSPTVWADWNSLTPLYNSSSWNGSFYTKVGKIVFLEISVKELTANTNAVIAQLPTGYRPLMSIEWDGFGGNAYLNHAHFKINASTGDITVYSADTYATGFISFPAM